jgi:hypothetical protein
VPRFRGYHDELAGESSDGKSAGESGDGKSADDDWLKNVPPFDSSLITNRDLDD